jgi:hypothetical protein
LHISPTTGRRFQATRSIIVIVTIDQNQRVAGCEIQNAACGKSGVMLLLKLVKTAEKEASNHQEDLQEHLPHGAKVLKSLALPWSN